MKVNEYQQFNENLQKRRKPTNRRKSTSQRISTSWEQQQRKSIKILENPLKFTKVDKYRYFDENQRVDES